MVKDEATVELWESLLFIVFEELKELMAPPAVLEAYHRSRYLKCEIGIAPK